MRLLSQLRKSSSRSWHSFQVNVGLEVFCLFCVLKIWEWTSDKMLIPIQIRLVIYFYWINHTFIEVFPFFLWTKFFVVSNNIWSMKSFQKSISVNMQHFCLLRKSTLHQITYHRLLWKFYKDSRIYTKL